MLTFLISVIFPIAEIVYNIFLEENTSIVYILLGYVIQLLIPIVIYWMFSFVFYICGSTMGKVARIEVDSP